MLYTPLSQLKKASGKYSVHCKMLTPPTFNLYEIILGRSNFIQIKAMGINDSAFLPFDISEGLSGSDVINDNDAVCASIVS